MITRIYICPFESSSCCIGLECTTIFTYIISSRGIFKRYSIFSFFSVTLRLSDFFGIRISTERFVISNIYCKGIGETTRFRQLVYSNIIESKVITRGSIPFSTDTYFEAFISTWVYTYYRSYSRIYSCTIRSKTEPRIGIISISRYFLRFDTT